MISKKNESLLKINGILLLNKSQGISSNCALQQAKSLFKAKKAGHTGSLDPLATGMLPVCFGEATKICQFLLDADKCYHTNGMLGVKTDTSDSTGKVVDYSLTHNVQELQLKKILTHYHGHIKQIPSMFSALKFKGSPLYRLAREGKIIARAARDVHIKKLQLTEFDGAQFSLKVVCSKGTYIRNLVEDIGDGLGVGAHVTLLHRLYTAGFESFPMYTIAELESMHAEERMACLLPLDKAIEHISLINLTDEMIQDLRKGKVIKQLSLNLDSDCVRLYNNQAHFVGLGEISSDGSLKAKRLLAFEPLKNEQK